VTKRIFLKFVLAFFGVILLAALLVDFLISRQYERNHTAALERSLEEKARLVADWLAETPPPDRSTLTRRAALRIGARVTLIATDGRVLTDSEAEPGAMENHGGRPEVVQALGGRAGSDTRLSHTLGTSFLYVATPFPGGGALRLAYPLAALERRLGEIRRRTYLASGLAVLAALLLAAVLAASVSRRLSRVVDFVKALAEGKFPERLPASGGDEVALVMEALNRTADQLREGFTRLAESNQRLEAVLEAMEEGVVAVDSHRRVLCANRAVRQLLGADVGLGSVLDQAIPEAEALEALDRALRTGHLTAADLRRGQPVRWLKMSCSAMLAAGGRPSGAVAVLHDVTELERLENIRRDFVANVSHELRTPLTSIQGYAETLLDSNLVGEARPREFVEIIRKHAERMAKLTADLLTLSRIELGRHEFRFAPTRAADLVHSAVQGVQQVSQSRQVDLVADPVPDELLVTADSDAIHQVLLNLLDNALKYTPAGGWVSLSARAQRDGVEFCVADSGIGIEAQHLPRLFERFYRVDKARSRELGGTGLGLSIVKHIVRAHGGEVRVQSEPGKGSSFFFTVPAAAATELVEAL
jgi:two-component system phosphate regulon sensor histidine kinase PhoR